MSQRHVRSTVRNNNNIDFYFIFPPPYPPPFHVEKCIDLVRVSIYAQDSFKHVLAQALEGNGFKADSNYFPTAGRFRSQTRWQRGSVLVTIFSNAVSLAGPGKHDCRTRLSILINCPNSSVLNLVKSTLQEYGIRNSLAKAEVAFDFYTQKPIDLHYFLAKHLIQVRQRKKALSIETTFYATDHASNITKGVKVYRKYENDRPDGTRCVRLEVTLNRGKLKALEKSGGIDSPLDLLDLDFSSYFVFRALKEERVRAFFFRKALERLSASRPPLSTSLRQLLRAQVDAWVGTTLIEAPVMKAVEVLKGKKVGNRNYGRDFLQQMLVQ